MTDLERRDIQYLIDALKRAEWAGEGQTCPVCRRQKPYGATHVCSCPIAIALVKVKPRLLGHEPLPEPEPMQFGAVHLTCEELIAKLRGGTPPVSPLKLAAAEAIERLIR